MTGECERKDKWFRGCHFEARYDSIPPKADELYGYKGTAHGFASAILALSKRTYVCDVCTTCGKKVVR